MGVSAGARVGLGVISGKGDLLGSCFGKWDRVSCLSSSRRSMKRLLSNTVASDTDSCPFWLSMMKKMEDLVCQYNIQLLFN